MYWRVQWVLKIFARSRFYAKSMLLLKLQRRISITKSIIQIYEQKCDALYRIVTVLHTGNKKQPLRDTSDCLW